MNSGKKTGKGGEELAETSNFCQFHIETRMPYGRALPNTRIKATFLTLDGTPFWVLSDETGTDGTFQLPIPDMPMPEHVVLQIHAEDGPRSADFSAFLKTEPFQSVSDSVKDSVPDTVTDSSSSSVNGSALFSASEQESDFIFDDTPLESVVGEIMVSSPQNQTFSSRSTSITLAERILSTPSVQMSVSAESNTRRPVFLGVWQENHLLTCRPFVAGNQARKVSLNLPETVSGMLSVLLIDASISPPRVLQHELVYRLPTYEPTLAVAQLHFLQNFASRMNTPEFRAEKQRIEYLPQNLENPTDENGFPTINP
ncbi:MAG: hypothetical protein Q4C70_14310, partial [Planctomycetia bacterium]|nr:hypothetical protein [Planctomycetia bacterium]